MSCKMTKILLPLLAAIVAGGCDYWCQDKYRVINTTDDTIRFVMYRDSLGWFKDGVNDKENNLTKENDSTHIVFPRSQITLETGAELCGKYYKPDDRRYEDDGDYFWGKWIKATYANSQPVDSAYWNTEKWEFQSKRRMRLYQLVFDGQ